MNRRTRVYVELDDQGVFLRIIKTWREACQIPPDRLIQYPRGEAVKQIRRLVFARSEGNCEWCSECTTWDTGEMHEVISKGDGGEVSTENCVFICHGCHQGRVDAAHGNRRWGGQKELKLASHLLPAGS